MQTRHTATFASESGATEISAFQVNLVAYWESRCQIKRCPTSPKPARLQHSFCQQPGQPSLQAFLCPIAEPVLSVPDLQQQERATRPCQIPTDPLCSADKLSEKHPYQIEAEKNLALQLRPLEQKVGLSGAAPRWISAPRGESRRPFAARSLGCFYFSLLLRARSSHCRVCSDLWRD